MRKALHFRLLLVIVSIFFPLLVIAQAPMTYIAKDGGNFSVPTNWSIASCPSCIQTASSTAPGPNDVIIIDGFDIVLDKDFILQASGSLTILSSSNKTIFGSLSVGAGFTLTSNSGTIKIGDGGTLIANTGGIINIESTSPVLEVAREGNITINNGGQLKGNANINLGDGQLAQRLTNLTVNDGGLVTVNQLRVNKATITVASTANITTVCNLALQNSNVNLNGTITVGGNLDMTTLNGQANNNTICGTGSMTITGCAFVPNGQQNQVLNNCTSGNRPKICAGPVANTSCPTTSTGTCNGVIINGKLVNGQCVPLPVELAEFTAVATSHQGVAVKWATASEKNNKEFTVERSADGQAFNGFRTVPGAGNSTRRTTYEAVDEQPLPGSSYYRLRQTDIDGTTSFSPVRAVKLSSSSAALEVYPGRTAQAWLVSSTLPLEPGNGNAAAVQVFDAVGRVQQVACTPDGSIAGRWTLDLHTLPSGIYIVRLLTASGSYSQRIAK